MKIFQAIVLEELSGQHLNVTAKNETESFPIPVRNMRVLFCESKLLIVMIGGLGPF